MSMTRSPSRLRPVNDKWYSRFWTVVTVLMFASAFWMVVASGQPLTWLICGLLAIQLVLYIRAIALTDWPIPTGWLAAYFIPGPILWAVTSYIDTRLWWMGMMYFGQMWGCLPPKAAIPGTLALMGAVMLSAGGWQIGTEIPEGMLIGLGFAWLGSGAVYLWISQVIQSNDERARLIKELETANTELQQAREREGELATLRERERLARDLHDNLGHALTTLVVQLEAVQRLYRVDPERASAQVDELKGLTRSSMSDLRRSLEGLRAPGLGDQALSVAIQQLCVQAGQKSGTDVRCDLDPAIDQLSPALAETAWRLVQESLTNIEKHADARHILVRAQRTSDGVQVTVDDDGRGLDPQAEHKRGHYGLRGLRERVEGLGGTFTVTALQPGTRVAATLPIIS